MRHTKYVPKYYKMPRPASRPGYTFSNFRWRDPSGRPRSPALSDESDATALDSQFRKLKNLNFYDDETPIAIYTENGKIITYVPNGTGIYDALDVVSKETGVPVSKISISSGVSPYIAHFEGEKDRRNTVWVFKKGDTKIRDNSLPMRTTLRFLQRQKSQTKRKRPRRRSTRTRKRRNAFSQKRKRGRGGECRSFHSRIH